MQPVLRATVWPWPRPCLGFPTQTQQRRQRCDVHAILSMPAPHAALACLPGGGLPKGIAGGHLRSPAAACSTTTNKAMSATHGRCLDILREQHQADPSAAFEAPFEALPDKLLLSWRAV